MVRDVPGYEVYYAGVEIRTTRTSEDLSIYFRDDVAKTAEAVWSVG